jgi:hypothetical protein
MARILRTASFMSSAMAFALGWLPAFFKAASADKSAMVTVKFSFSDSLSRNRINAADDFPAPNNKIFFIQLFQIRGEFKGITLFSFRK